MSTTSDLSPPSPDRARGPSARPATGLAVVGAGPGGLAGALAAADGGIPVTLIDAGRQIGGQFYRQPAARLHARRPQALHHHVRTWLSLRRRFDVHVAAGRIRYLPEHQVWFAQRSDGGFDLHALSAADRDGAGPDRSVSVHADTLLLATGAYEKVLPFPGWTLPGVITAGAAQAMLKGTLVLPGRAVVVAGTGPLLLPVAAGLAQAGARVSALIESADARELRGLTPVLAAHPGKLAEAAGYAATLVRHRVPIRYRHAVLAAHGATRVEAVTVAALDRHGQVRQEPVQLIPCDALAVGHGLLPHLELADALGARLLGNGEQAVWVDDEQRTDIPGLWAAGESTGIGGSALAVVEGEIAGRSIAATLLDRKPDAAAMARLARTRARLRDFFAALDRVYSTPVTMVDALADTTVVCRCEEVSAGAVRAAARELGATDPRTIKLLTRAGMGWCQGRMCAPGVAAIAGCPAAAARTPFARPVPLGILAQSGEADEEGNGTDE
jgi:NADPH-dependent 2,4-dienoyl-CoA reductase/sulfur reductase-like enzyme